MVKRVCIKAHFVAQALGIQSPALDKRGAVEVVAKIWQVFDLLGQCQLQMVAGHGFVQRECRHGVFGPRGQIVGIHVIDAGAGAVHRRGVIIRLRGCGGTVVFDLF